MNEGEKKAKMTVARNLPKAGLNITFIAETIGSSLDEIKKL
ncbi:MAG: hypothetical protein PV340_04600 [Wolbachia sp.]|nr:hypothetical protein [Wolbachia sp.]MDD9336487.1 hypothetical protein [Wolbachia sp.]